MTNPSLGPQPRWWQVATNKAPKPTCNVWPAYNIDRSTNCNYSAQPSLVPSTTACAQKEPLERMTRTLRLDPFTTHAHVFSTKRHGSCMQTSTPFKRLSWKHKIYFKRLKQCLTLYGTGSYLCPSSTSFFLSVEKQEKSWMSAKT